MPNKPTFNPLSGLITSGWQHIVLLTAVVGETFDRTCSIGFTFDETQGTHDITY